MNPIRRRPFSDAEKAPGRTIAVKVVGHGVSALYRMPWSDRGVEALGGLPADMLHGATLILDESVIEARRKGAVQSAAGLERDRLEGR